MGDDVIPQLSRRYNLDVRPVAGDDRERIIFLVKGRMHLDAIPPILAFAGIAPVRECAPTGRSEDVRRSLVLLPILARPE